MSAPLTIRSLDESGDWNWGQSLSSLATGQDAIAENVQTRLLFFQNDWPWAMDFGVDWFNLLGQFNPAAETGILLQTREVIAESTGITSINSVTIQLNANTRGIVVTYDLSSIYTQFTGVAEPEN